MADKQSEPQKLPQKQMIESSGEKYTTELDYISTWDTLNYEPSDVYMHGVEQLFEDGAFETGENYPRGV